MRRVLAYLLRKGQLWESVEGLRATPTMLTRAAECVFPRREAGSSELDPWDLKNWGCPAGLPRGELWAGVVCVKWWLKP